MLAMVDFASLLNDKTEPLTADEFEKMKDQSPDSFSGRRNRAIMDWMIHTGARVGATVKMKRQDVDLQDRTASISPAKLSSDRVLKLDPDYVDSLLRYLQLEGRPDSEWLFPGLDGGRLSTRYVRKFFNSYARGAGLSTERVHPHLLRHTFASRFLKATDDLEALRQALGHEDIRTTIVYLHDLPETSVDSASLDLATYSADLPEPD